MNSAAKLRTRGIAAFGATVLVATAFGPAAMAWEAPDATPEVAKTGSIGLMDTSVTTEGTQGAKAVIAGQSSQAVGDIVMAVPATYQKGDYIDLALPQQVDPNARVTWAGLPSIKVDGPKATGTIVNPTSPASPAANNAAQGQAANFAPTGSDVAPTAPSITPTIVGGAYGDKTIRLTFNSSVDASNFNAKFVVTLSGLKVNAGSKAAGGTNGEVVVTASAHDAAGTVRDGFFGGSTAAKPETVPAYISRTAITTSSSALINSTTPTAQALGDVEVRATSGTFGAGDFKLTIDPATATTATDQVSVTFYDASGNALNTTPEKVAPADGVITVADAQVPDAAVRAVVSGAIVTPIAGQTQVKIAVNTLGAITPPAGPLTSTNVNQTDIAVDTANSMAMIPLTNNANRVSGASRYETALQVANGQYANAETDNVVIASGAKNNFADALSATYLAYEKKAPVLLVQPDTAPQVVKDFMYNHGAKRAFIVGGETAVSAAVANELAGLTATDWTTPTDKTTLTTTGTSKVQVTRLSGTNRYDTNRVVNSYAATSSGVGMTVGTYGKAAKPSAIIANGEKPWDALAAGPLVGGQTGITTAGTGLPIILTSSASTFRPEAMSQLKGFNIGRTIFVGGAAVLPDALATQSATDVTRLAGTNRFNTAEHIGNFLVKSATASSTNTEPGFGRTGTTPYLVNGGYNSLGQADDTKWADALALAPRAAAEGNALALTAGNKLPADTQDFLRANNTLFTDVTPVGGTDVIADALVNAARQLVN
ncbi:N-acetylmuramoyl-L-alanine amidase LytC precursor [Dermatophilus congolensis]|uniref:N-acetylmuramoyl-L-alanine amidase LytC n=1 Tax=Dermatophilus congolensis TaxID=1863 RepID=A0A239VDJ7_9MICO|nr:cell wall-binding repeat-containing protein [Dermatophilus congolensis]SNV19743.1 N-acetylmuramoyl-L-alanine amidase LytC precursor [Dermatophilus congolensis]